MSFDTIESVPLIFSDTSGCSQLLLIDSTIKQPNIMANSVNSITLPVTYSHTSTRADLLYLLRNRFTTIARIGIAFSSYQDGGIHPFLENEMFFNETESYNENVTFLISLIQEFKVKHIDYLACNTLKYPIWINYFETIKNAGVTVGASNNKTGNMMYNGDWVLESINQDIELVYFTEKINFYNYVLDTNYILWFNSGNSGFIAGGYRSLAGLNGKLYLVGFTGTASVYSIPEYSSGSTPAATVAITYSNKAFGSGNPNYITVGGFTLYIQSSAGFIYNFTESQFPFGVPATTKPSWNATQFTLGTIPFGLSFDSTNNNIYFASGSGGKVFLFNSGGTSITNITLPSTTNYTLTAGSIISDGVYIYVVSASNTSAIHRYTFTSNTLTLETLFWAQKLGPTLYNYGVIKSLAYDDTYIYVAYATFIVRVYKDTYGTINTTNESNSPQWLTGFTNISSIYVFNSILYIINNNVTIYVYTIVPPAPVINYVCFKEDSLILTDHGYKPVQDLRKGHLVKTISDGYKPIHMICKQTIEHKPVPERIGNQLYQCSQDNYPEVFEPLVITGHHSILVDDFISEEQKQRSIQVNGKLFITGQKYRLPACVDERATIYDKEGNYTIYHFALENDNYYANYGVYANGLLVETCSKRYLSELSNMEVID